MELKSVAVLSVCCMAVCSCKSSLVVSTLQTTSNDYIPQPIKAEKEPNKTETFAGFQMSRGMNTREPNNHFASMDGRIARSHALGQWRLAYGIKLLLGGIDNRQAPAGASEAEKQYLQEYAGKFFMGSVGSNASISYSIPMKTKKGEWRVAGLQVSANKEFGDFLAFRKKLPFAINRNADKSALNYTAGVFSEWVCHTWTGVHMGWKLAGSIGFYRLFKNLGKQSYHLLVDDKYEDSNPRLPLYVSITHFQRMNRFNGYVQINTGRAFTDLQVGTIFTLGKQ